MSVQITFTTLGVDDIADITSMLNDVWASSYGPTGSPRFTSEYLMWLYGLPDGHDNLLIGGRVDGRLVAMKALLRRSILH